MKLIIKIGIIVLLTILWQVLAHSSTPSPTLPEGGAKPLEIESLDGHAGSYKNDSGKEQPVF